MTDYLGSTLRDRPALRRAAVLLVVLLALALVALGGSLLHAQSASPAPRRSAVVGRTSTVCTVQDVDAAATAAPTPSSSASPDPSPSSSPSDSGPAPTPASPTPEDPASPTPASPTPASPTPASPTPASPTPASPTPASPTPVDSAGPTPTATPVATPSPEPTPTAANTATTGADTTPSTVSAVAVRQGSDDQGTLTGSPLAGGDAELTLTQQGSGKQLPQVSAPVVLTGEGSMATAGSGVVSSTSSKGETTGLMAAPCLVPGTEQWLVGIGSTDADRTELILSNPDDAQAEVDLRFYGPKGRLVVPGSPGVVIGARETKTLSVSSLIDSDGPTSVSVRTSEGRVSVAARRLRSDKDLKPAGADWQVPSVTPATTSVVPGVPGGDGSRVLAVVNPGTARATVQVEVLGLSGAFAPADAATLVVAPESTATVELTAGLAGDSGSIRLRSDQPVSGSVVSTSSRSDAVPDFAVQSTQPALVRQGVSALATTTGPTDSELVLSNGGDTDAALTFEVLSYTGVSLRKDDLLLGAGSTATRRLTSPGPSYVVVTVPGDSAVVGSVTLSQPDGDVAGLTTVPLTSPDVASRAPRVRQDPAVAR
ncbi:DUF5719 family protein [uncultured Friedmanniella sp.]|uniref:DUF5719 family protein n=1 Tax=uncultured Friedmanniella sp. TaxID=335381 RepID=UPI0035CBBBB8